MSLENIIEIESVFDVFHITPFPVSPKGEMIYSHSFPFGGRLGRGCQIFRLVFGT
jgi:hypothetical protein